MLQYEDAEMFVSAFETILHMNEIDVEKEWNKFLPTSFLNCKNEKVQRWFKTHIIPILETADWEIVKIKLLDRYGKSASSVNNITHYLDIKQGKEEFIHDYMDRYLETYRRLPEESRGEKCNQVDAMKFIRSLLTRTMDTVIKFLKDKKLDHSDSYIPKTLEQLFDFIARNRPEINEALYLSTKIKSNNNNNQSATNNNLKRERVTTKNLDENDHKKTKFENNKTNICNFCRKEPFSYKHLEYCIPYFNSDKYKMRIINENNMKNNQIQKKVNIPIFFNETQNSKIDINSFSKLYENIDQDILKTFKELEKIVNFNPFTYHKTFSTKNKDLNNKFNPNIKELTCYMVDGYSKEELDKLSPYSPFIVTINNEKLISILDTGSDISLINQAYNFEDKSIFENIIPTQGTLSFVKKDSSCMRIGKTKLLEVVYRGRKPFLHSFEIIEMPNAHIPILLGRDLIPKLGIQITNTAHTFEEEEKIIFEDSIDEDVYIPNVTNACTEEEYDEFMKSMERYIKDNQNINIHELCPLEEAKVYLNTKPNAVAYARQLL